MKGFRRFLKQTLELHSRGLLTQAEYERNMEIADAWVIEINEHPGEDRTLEEI